MLKYNRAPGGTGQAAIQVAKYVGAEVYVTVGSDDKRRLTMDTYDVSEDHIFYSRNTSFAEGIMRMTCNRGVDVVLNSLSGEALVASWECIAPVSHKGECGTGIPTNSIFSAVASLKLVNGILIPTVICHCGYSTKMRAFPRLISFPS